MLLNDRISVLARRARLAIRLKSFDDLHVRLSHPDAFLFRAPLTVPAKAVAVVRQA